MEFEMGVQMADEGLDKRKKKSAIRKNAIKFTKIVSLVGLRHATDSRNSLVRRFIWLVWVLFGVFFAIYQIQDRIVYYLSYPSETEVKFMSNQSLRLPQVTICEDKIEPYTSEVTKQIKDKMTTLKEAEAKKDGTRNENDIKRYKQELSGLLESLHNETREWEELSKNKSLTAEKAVLEVSFNSRKDKTHIKEVVTEMGYCFAFSPEVDPLNTNKTGVKHGLNLKLMATPSDQSSGFKVLIHDHLVTPAINQEGILLRQGTLTRVAVSLESVSIKGPFDECNSTDAKYKQDNCLKDCDYRLFLRQFGCRDIHMPATDGNATVCSYANILNYTDFGVKRSENENENATTPHCLCAPECNTTKYKMSITQSVFPQYGNTVYLYVYFQHFTFMTLRNIQAYSFLELLCDIGGALSLLLGATLLTVYETAEFSVVFIKDYLYLRLAK